MTDKVLAPVLRQRFFDNNGNPLSGGKLYTYVAGSAGAVNKPTYVSATGAANANPVVLDANGYADIFLDTGSYLLTLRDSAGNLIWTVDNMTAFPFGILSGSSGADSIGYIGPGANAVARTVQGKLRDGAISVKDFGCLGNDVADDIVGINLAIAYAVATGRSLLFPEGTYKHSATLVFGYANFHVFFDGQVTLHHTGAGKAVTYDGGAVINIGFYNTYFGWGNPPTIQGNVNTTDALYIRGSHHMKVDVRVRDCTTALRVEFSVDSIFYLNCSSNEGPFAFRTPTNILVVDRRAAPEATTGCTFHVIAEGAGALGIDLICAQYCHFYGTSESNTAGGVRVRFESLNNNFLNFFCEANGAAEHFNIEGNDNTFINCSGGGVGGAGANNNTVSGIRNHFIGGLYHKLTETGYYNSWDQVSLPAYVALFANSIKQKCHDGAGVEIADCYPPPTIIAPALAGLWVASTGVGMRAPGYWKDALGFVHIVGGVKSGAIGSLIFNLPAGYRPGGTLWFQRYNPSAGINDVLAIPVSGDFQHISGDTGAVPIDVTFYAEN